MPDPCKNDGVCSETTDSTSLSFRCECSELYTGQTCEAEKSGNKTILVSLFLLHTPFSKMGAIMEKTELALRFYAVNE